VNIGGGNNFAGSFQISPDNYVDPVIGTPYLNPDWMYGKLVLGDQTELEGLFRYNVYGQELEMVYNKDTLGQLLIKYRADVENNSYSTTYMGGGGDGRDYYIHKSSYYYKITPGTAARKVKRRKKDLLTIFSDHKDEISLYMKSERLNPRVDEDLLALFRYFDQLEK